MENHRSSTFESGMIRGTVTYWPPTIMQHSTVNWIIWVFESQSIGKVRIVLGRGKSAMTFNEVETWLANKVGELNMLITASVK